MAGSIVSGHKAAPLVDTRLINPLRPARGRAPATRLLNALSSGGDTSRRLPPLILHINELSCFHALSCANERHN